ncbi:MAG: hypothetical protein ABH846_01050 [Patescibacteria group bacterium]
MGPIFVFDKFSLKYYFISPLRQETPLPTTDQVFTVPSFELGYRCIRNQRLFVIETFTEPYCPVIEEELKRLVPEAHGLALGEWRFVCSPDGSLTMPEMPPSLLRISLQSLVQTGLLNLGYAVTLCDQYPLEHLIAVAIATERLRLGFTPLVSKYDIRIIPATNEIIENNRLQAGFRIEHQANISFIELIGFPPMILFADWANEQLRAAAKKMLQKRLAYGPEIPIEA